MSAPGMGRGRGAVIGKGGRSGGAQALVQQHLHAAARENEARGAAHTVGSWQLNPQCASWEGAPGLHPSTIAASKARGNPTMLFLLFFLVSLQNFTLSLNKVSLLKWQEKIKLMTYLQTILSINLNATIPIYGKIQ